MKRHGNLYCKIYDFENLCLAFDRASRGRRYDTEVLRFRRDLEENLIGIQNELIWKTYEPRPYKTFKLFEPKERIISVAPFRDRVVHHAIMNIIEPIWDGLFIYDTYACRKGKGAHAGMYRVVEFLRAAGERWANTYCFKGDISKCFPSINHRILLSIIERKIKCRNTLWLFDKIIFNGGERERLDSHNLPIGNLISQWAANLYLSELDYFIKNGLRVKYYVRYMDDFVLLGGDKKELHKHKREVADFLYNKLRMSLNPKSDVFPARRGVDFLGYRIWPIHRLLRKSSLIRASRRFKRLSNYYARGIIGLNFVRASVMSWLGHCKHANAERGVKRCLRDLILQGVSGKYP